MMQTQRQGLYTADVDVNLNLKNKGIDMEKKEAIYKMDLFDKVDVGYNVTFERVPGGWIRQESWEGPGHNEWDMVGTFIPYNEEFKTED